MHTLVVKRGETGEEKTIELNAESLKDAVSQGHDNDFDYNVRMIKYDIDLGMSEGMTSIDRYPGGSSDQVYWRLVKNGG